MRKYFKNNILEVFASIYEAHGVVKDLVSRKEYSNAQNLLADCQDTALELSDAIEASEGEGFVTVLLLEEYCKALYEAAVSLSDENNADILERIDAALAKVEESAKNDIQVRLEVVFCPYKASMWDSLESIWRAAVSDPNCDVYVVAAPYYDRNPDHSFGAFHYEGNCYPDYVPIIHYDQYDFETRMPDIVYIHNPYDNCNYVTSVDPRFYSFELKKHTPMLVYVPYHISTFFADFSTAPNNIASGFRYSDRIITQSKIQKEYYAAGGIAPDKLLALGSPKTDYIINNLDSVDVPKQWEEITEGKITFMLNTSIAYLLRIENWAEEMNKIIDIFANDESCALIWRPHPLLDATVRSMRPNMLNAYLDVMQRAKTCSNIVLDTEDSAYPAMKLSDALISDSSSLVAQFSLTNKPVLLTDGTVKQRECNIVNFDYFENYFVEDGATIPGFIEMVKNGEDEKKNTRLSAIYASVENADGTCGQKIHDVIVNI